MLDGDTLAIERRARRTLNESLRRQRWSEDKKAEVRTAQRQQRLKKSEFYNASARERTRNLTPEQRQARRKSQARSRLKMTHNQRERHYIAQKASAHRRRLKERDLGKYSVDEWNQLLSTHGNRCAACGKTPPLVIISVDHIVPIGRGGVNTIDNIQPLCTSCNCIKNARTINFLNGGEDADEFRRRLVS